LNNFIELSYRSPGKKRQPEGREHHFLAHRGKRVEEEAALSINSGRTQKPRNDRRSPSVKQRRPKKKMHLSEKSTTTSRSRETFEGRKKGLGVAKKGVVSNSVKIVGAARRKSFTTCSRLSIFGGVRALRKPFKGKRSGG